MFLRSNTRIKDGKQHRYYTVVESRRLQSGKATQRQVLYLGEINDSQQAAWRRTLEVFDEAEQRLTPLSLFPEDRPVPADAIDSVQVKLSEMRLERARAVWQLLAGMRTMAAVATGSVLVGETAAGAGERNLAAGAGIAGSEPAD
jgi:hypothetical protein